MNLIYEFIWNDPLNLHLHLHFSWKSLMLQFVCLLEYSSNMYFDGIMWAKNVNLNFQTWSAKDQPLGETCQIQNIKAGCEIKEGAGCHLQFSRAAKWQGGPVLSCCSLLLCIHVPCTVRKESTLKFSKNFEMKSFFNSSERCYQNFRWPSE